MNAIIVEILVYLTVFSFIIPLTAGIIYLSRLSFQMKLLVYLMAIAGICEMSSFFIYELLNTHYYWVFHIYFPIEYTFFALIFSGWIKNDLYSKAVKYSIPLFWVISILNSLFWQNLNDLNSYSITLGLIIYTIITLYVLYQAMAVDLGQILKSYIFWISTGLLVFSAGDLAYFAFHPLVKEHYLVAIWAIHSIFNVITYIFYSIGIICQGRKWE